MVENDPASSEPCSKRPGLIGTLSDARQVLMASDAMTRGMDVEAVAHVVNYDAPVYAKTYVHRCGRTARAGRLGRAFTLLRKQVRNPYSPKNLMPNEIKTYHRGGSGGRGAPARCCASRCRSPKPLKSYPHSSFST